MTGRAENLARVLRGLAAFVTLSAVMGLLAAGLAIPAVGATGSAIKGGIGVFNDLPGDLTASPLNQQSKILDAKGNVIATPYAENRIIVPLKSVAPIMQKAQIAIEDSRFYEHGGLDVRGLSRAVVATLQGNKQGASTLTQQYVKMTLQENALNADNQQAANAAAARTGMQGIARKVQELKYAVNLEQTHTKDEILGAYLNLAYYGDLAYGVEAAAEHYFSIPASQLNYIQAALLAGTVQRPSETDPVNYPKAAFDRRNVVLDRMAELGVITSAQATAGKKVTIASMLKVEGAQNTCQRSTQPYFCTYVMEWLKTQPSLGKDVAERIRNINTAGLTIQTTLDPGLSDYITKTLSSKVPIGDPSNVGSAAAVVQPGTGKILGIGQTSKFPVNGQKGWGYTEQNWTADAKYGGSTYGFQIGSSAKAFILATALANGIPVEGTIRAKPAGPRQAAVYTPSDYASTCGWVGPQFNVRNDYMTGGTITLRKATSDSINTAFASLVAKLGICAVQKMDTAFGLHQGNGQPIQNTPSVVTLGADPISPITMAAAYAGLAADGKFCTPIPVVSVTDTTNKKLTIETSKCSQAVTPDVARGVSELLQGVITSGTGTAAQPYLNGRPAAGKTGTTDNHFQSWFVGYTPQISTAVWVGTPVKTFSMKGITIGGSYYAQGVFGGDIAAPLWAKIVNYASQDLPVKNFPSPSDTVTNGDMVSIPSVVGMSQADATAVLAGAGFSAYRESTVYSTIPGGLVAGTNPSGRAIRGSSVGLYISSGYIPQPQPSPSPSPSPPTSPTTPPTQPVPTKTHPVH
ncbi:MAG: transglycosylase domain-containing protein [Nostocoides sp.]